MRRPAPSSSPTAGCSIGAVSTVTRRFTDRTIPPGTDSCARRAVMKRRADGIARAGVLLALFLAAVIPALAEDTPPSETAPPAESAPEPPKPAAVSTAPEGSVLFGTNYFADETNPDSAKFEEYREVPN